MNKYNIRCEEIESSSLYLKEIKRIYNSSFPKNERIAFDEIKNLSFPNSKLLGFFDNSIFLGFSYVSVLEEFAYIVYLAIDEKLRNKGYGTKILNTLINMFSDKVKVLCIELPSSKTQIRRCEFYIRNGFNLADFQFELYSQKYYVMYKGEFDKDKFLKFLNICFPGCENFKSIEKMIRSYYARN